ncbi:type VI secretion system protein ImpG [Pseudoduganella lurida]|uniref:Type VI secretion system protein ImpG n=1 Tax=Pseudoduganella lurida TaxID=1036180 RepID=A0A562RA86_9BURK|nr:type VI secretion system baseplate subunit TssF [Pseudoduganella lurida]TWI65474.1 type VI secretion system protein ImpG [Pseudoduganella lurida]
MKKLREYYERELGLLHGYAQEFAADYPAQAMHLGMADGAGDDPHVERLIQATALSNARVARLLDDSDGKLTEALLNVNYPHYLRPFPATANIHIDTGAVTAVTRVQRGTVLSASSQEGMACKFRTVQDVFITPLVLSRATFHAIADLPPYLARPADVASSLSIRIEGPAGFDLRALDVPALRLLIAGESSLCALVRDVLFLQAQAAWVELPDGRWRALDAVPLAPAGFSAEEAVLPWPPAAHPAFRLLAEYFACPDRFNFLDLMLAPLLRPAPAGSHCVTLHLGLKVPSDSPAARLLAGVSKANLLTHCTPVVNLFRRSASPIEMTHATPDYELLPDAASAGAYDVYSVDRVSAISAAPRDRAPVEYRPYYAAHHGEQQGKGRYWLLRRDAIRAVTHPGHELRIALVDGQLDPLAENNASVSIDLTCTNRDIPARLRHGAPEGDLQLEQGTQGWTLRFLQRPTPQYRFNAEHHWRLISLLSFSQAALGQQGVEGLREALALHDLRQSAITQRQIRGVAALDLRRARTWLRDDWHTTPVFGTDIRVTLDEQAFTGASLHLFAQVLDHFFGLCAHLNTFTRLTIVSLADGKELMRCQPRHGDIPLA